MSRYPYTVSRLIVQGPSLFSKPCSVCPPEPIVIIAWILFTGFWDDAGEWKDTEVWVD